MTRPARGAATPSTWMLRIVLVIGVFATTLLSVPRWLDTTNYRLIQLASVTPAGLPVALVTMLVAGWLVRRASVGGRSWTAGAAAIAATAVTVHLAWLLPLYLGPAPPAEPGRPFVMLAQNLEYGSTEDLARVAAVVDPAVVVLSDINPGQVSALERSPLMDRYPHRFGLRSDTMSGMVVLSSSPIGPARRAGPGWEMLRLDTAELGPVDLLAFHPSPPYDGAAWRSSFAGVTTFLTERAASGVRAPLVVAGDLNATQDHLPLRRLLATGLRDAAEEANAGYEPTWPVGGSRRLGPFVIPEIAALDHVLVDERLVATRATTVAIDGADHLGVSVSMLRAGSRE